MDRPKKSLIILINFFVGTTIFIYEILWMRMLALVFGTTTTATVIVLMVFMAGLGFGGLYFGRRADRTNHPDRLFAVCSFGTALSALIVFFAIDPVSPLYGILQNLIRLPGNPMYMIVAASIILMIIPTFFMGATIPLLSRMYIPDTTRIGPGVSLIYAIHISGNILGAFLTGYILIAFWGQTLTQVIAMIISIFAGVIILTVPSFSRNKVTKDTYPAPSKHVHEGKKHGFVLLTIACITGFCGLALEVLWTRVMRTYIANSTYNFTNVIIIYLAGIFLGSLIFYRFLSRKKGPGLLSTSQLAIGYYVLLSLVLINQLPNILYLMRNLLSIPLLRIVLPGMTLSLIMILVPTVFMGITFPVLCKLYTRQFDHLGRRIGVLLFVNMCGGIAGSLVTHFSLIPLVGVIRSFGIIALLICFNALLVLIISRSQKIGSKRTIATSTAFCGALLLFMVTIQNTMILPPSIYRSGLRSDQVIHYEETHNGTVIVTEDFYTGIRACYINNNAVCGTTYDALKVVRMLGHLPYIFNPHARTVCVIGFGIGITTSSLAEHDPDSIDCIEICPEVADAALFFQPYNHDVLSQSNVHLIPEDGRTHLYTTQKQYDIISCDPTHPTLGCNNLYTKEYFQLCKKRLSPGGIVCQYLPFHKLSLNEFKIVIRTFLSEFPHVSIWLAHAHAVMVGTVHEQEIDFVALTALLEIIDDDIIHDPYDIASSLILNETSAHVFVREGQLNTDNYPVLEFFSPASTTKDNWDRNLYELLTHRIRPALLIRNISEPERLEQYIAAQQYFLSALIFKNQGKLDDMLRAMEIAHRINPASEEIRLFLEHERSQLRPYQ